MIMAFSVLRYLGRAVFYDCDIFLYSGTFVGLCSVIMTFSKLRYLGRIVFCVCEFFWTPVP